MKLIFIPGSGGPVEEWAYQTKYFADSTSVPLPGHPDGKPCLSVEDYTTWLRGYIQQHRFKDIVLVGHSMGGAVAMQYGLKYGDETKGLVLIGTSAAFHISPNSFAALEPIVRNHDEASYRKYAETFYRFVAPDVKPIVLEARLRVGAAVILNDLRCCDKFNIKDKVQDIKLPTLIIGGTNDEKAPLEYTEFLAQQIQGAKELIIDGTHWIYMEKHEEVNKAIGEFVLSLKVSHLTL